MKTFTRILYAILLAGSLATIASADWTFTITDAITPVTVREAGSVITVQENSLTPSATFTIWQGAQAPAAGVDGTVVAIGGAYSFGTAGTFQVNQIVGWIQAGSSGPFTFAAVRTPYIATSTATLQGRPISATAPTAINRVLCWNDTAKQWEAGTCIAGLGGTGVLFADGGGLPITDATHFVYNSTTHALGISGDIFIGGITGNNRAQLRHGAGATAGVSGTLLTVDASGVSDNLSMDLAGNMGVLGNLSLALPGGGATSVSGGRLGTGLSNSGQIFTWGLRTSDDGADNNRAYISFATTAGSGGSDSSISFATNHYGVGAGTRMLINRDGLVSIGGNPVSSANLSVIGDNPKVDIFSNTAVAADNGGTINFGANTNEAMGWIGGFSTAAGGSNGYLAFATRHSDTPTEFMRLTAAGLLGIGTTDPQVALHVKGSVNSDGESVGLMVSPSADDTHHVQIGYNSAGDYGTISAVDSGIGWRNLSLAPSGGFVGIGMTGPTSPLQVAGIPIYANNAAAVAGGLTAGAFYRTGADPDPLMVVH